MKDDRETPISVELKRRTFCADFMRDVDHPHHKHKHTGPCEGTV